MPEQPPPIAPGILRLSNAEAQVARVKVIVEQHPDGFVAYPLGIEGVVIGEGDSRESALADVTSAIAFHIASFGSEVLDSDSPVLDVFVEETDIPG